MSVHPPATFPSIYTYMSIRAEENRPGFPVYLIMQVIPCFFQIICYNKEVFFIHRAENQTYRVIKMKRRYSTAQIDYLGAKERFLHTSKQADKKLAEMKEKGKEIGQDEMEEAIEKSGFHKAYNDLIQAGNRLIEWSHFYIKNETEYKERKASFEQLFKEGKNQPESRSILVDMAMHLKYEG